MGENIKAILMDRDGMSEEEANSLIEQAKEDLQERIDEGDMPFDICEEWFGLEPDYLDDLIELPF